MRFRIFPRFVHEAATGTGEGSGTTTPPAQDPPKPQDPPAPAPGSPEFNDLAAKFRKAQDELEALKKAEAERKKAEMTELERAKLELEEERKAKAKLQRDVLVSKVATAHKLPPDLWDRLRGETEEELAADAALLKGHIKGDAKPGNTGGDDPKPPTQPTGEKTKLEAELEEAKKTGDSLRILEIKTKLRQLGAK